MNSKTSSTIPIPQELEHLFTSPCGSSSYEAFNTVCICLSGIYYFSLHWKTKLTLLLVLITILHSFLNSAQFFSETCLTYFLHTILQKPLKIECPRFDVDRYNARSTGFTELLSEWMLPLYESSIILDMAVGEGRNTYFTACIKLYDYTDFSLYKVSQVRMVCT